MNPQKLLATVLTLGAGLLASKGLSAGWRAITGHEPPKSIDDDGEISIVEVVIFAAASAAAAAFVRAYVDRRTKRWMASGDVPR